MIKHRLMITAIILSPVPAWAVDVGGEVALLSDYRDRGLSQSNKDPVLQAALDVDVTERWRLFAWASQLRDNPLGDAEINLGGSYAGDIGTLGFYTLGAQAVLFADGAGGDYGEIYGSMGLDYGLLVASIGVNYAPDRNDLGGGESLYLDTRLDASFPGKPFGATFSAGYEYLSRQNDKIDWSAGVFYSVESLTFSLRYVDSDSALSRGSAAAILGLRFGF